jgi:two-component system, OmpR family, phosphate regulon response regulator PhoB
MADKILIVEDDRNIYKLLKYNLEKAGFICRVTVTGEEALEILDVEKVDLVILDIMLPKKDGLEVCKEIKQDQILSAIPIIMLTAKGEEIDRVVGFQVGADDYVVKPFSPRELVLRVKSVLRRKNIPEPAGILSINTIVVDPQRRKVSVGKRTIELTPMEFNLLAILIKRKERVQSRDRLLDDVWGISADVTTRTVDTHIKRLRKKLGKEGRSIKTVRGLGYKIEGD